jgi:5'-nucleotidase
LQTTNTRLILFDLDNTLLNLTEYWEDSIREAFRQLAVTSLIDIDALYPIFKTHDELFCKLYDEGHISLWDFRRERFIESLKHFGIAATNEDALEFHELFTSLTNQFIKPNEKLGSLLTKISKRYMMGIITNGTPNFQKNKINQLGIGTHFKQEGLFISEEVGYSKPAKEIYQLALDYFAVSAAEVIFVGDSLSNDVIAPMNMGMKAIWVNNNTQQLPEAIIPYAIITMIDELEQILL